MKTITILGGGNMGGAIAKAVAKSYTVTVIEPLGNFNEPNVKTEKFLKDISSDFIILAIKPQLFDDVLPELNFDGVIISIAAGINIEKIKKMIGDNIHVIRTMPNLATSVGKGTTAICRDSSTTDWEFSEAKKIFDMFGETVEVKEKDMDTVVALSGSSPAYGFMLLNAMVEFGMKNNLDYDTSLKLSANAIAGSMELALNSDKRPNELTDMVCSPNGTTIEAVNYLKNNDFEQIIERAMDNCKKRSEELS